MGATLGPLSHRAMDPHGHGPQGPHTCSRGQQPQVPRLSRQHVLPSGQLVVSSQMTFPDVTCPPRGSAGVLRTQGWRVPPCWRQLPLSGSQV